ncbi:MAG: hypothetical protein N3I35_12395 [Clostridia bacterium]|nr:hypothetical protein [Clostridia bacterium]
MNCNIDFYLCKNLLYWDSVDLKGYVCTISGKKCSCQGNDCTCLAYEEDLEE